MKYMELKEDILTNGVVTKLHIDNMYKFIRSLSSDALVFKLELYRDHPPCNKFERTERQLIINVLKSRKHSSCNIL